MMIAHTTYVRNIDRLKKRKKNVTHTKSERNGERVRAERDGDTPTDVRTRAAARVSTASREEVTVKVLNHIPIPREYY